MRIKFDIYVIIRITPFRKKQKQSKRNTNFLLHEMHIERENTSKLARFTGIVTGESGLIRGVAFGEWPDKRDGLWRE